MTQEQLKNVGFYVLYALAGALVATGLQLATMLAGSGDLVWRPLAATFTTALFSALATAIGTSTLTRYGSEPIARQVNDLREQGYHRADMQVVPKRGAEPDLSTVDAPVAHPLTYVVLHGSSTGHVAFLTTAAPISGAEMAADQAFHVTDHRPYGTDPPFACDSCEELLDHVAVVESEWIAISQADATLDALDLPEPGRGERG